MARLAKKFGFEFSKKPDVNGANHDKWYVQGEAVIVPRHNEINELTAKSILRTWEEMLDEAAKLDEKEGE
jgi:mRNA interferase HicA